MINGKHYPLWGALTNCLRYYCADLNWQKIVVCILCVLEESIGFIVLQLNKRYITSPVIAGLLFGFLFLLCSEIDNKFFARRTFKLFIFIQSLSFQADNRHVQSLAMLSFERRSTTAILTSACRRRTTTVSPTIFQVGDVSLRVWLPLYRRQQQNRPAQKVL